MGCEQNKGYMDRLLGLSCFLLANTDKDTLVEANYETNLGCNEAIIQRKREFEGFDQSRET